jgi:hypothetical protein
MDADGDGEISEFEFIKFMMTTAGMADEETLDALHKRFQVMSKEIWRRCQRKTRGHICDAIVAMVKQKKT